MEKADWRMSNKKSFRFYEIYNKFGIKIFGMSNVISTVQFSIAIIIMNNQHCGMIFCEILKRFL